MTHIVPNRKQSAHEAYKPKQGLTKVKVPLRKYYSITCGVKPHTLHRGIDIIVDATLRTFQGINVPISR